MSLSRAAECFVTDTIRERLKRRTRPDDETFVPRETCSFEVAHVHGLWHLDFHEGSRAVLTASGERRKPQLLGILDDHSRLWCHLQTCSPGRQKA